MSISNNGFVISKDIFRILIGKYGLSRFKLKEVLLKNPNGIQKFPAVINLYQIIGENVRLPREFQKMLPNEDIKVRFNKCRRFDNFNIDIAEHQRIVLADIVKRFNKKGYGTYLSQVATGLGKTRIGIGLIGKVGSVTLVIVPTKHIANQWIDEIQTLNKNLKCILYNNKILDINDIDVTICVINTARDKDLIWYSQFNLVILDEVHEYASKSNKNAIWKGSGCRFILGLTATPEYTQHGFLPFLESHLGKTIYARNLKGFDTTTKNFIVNVEIINYIGGANYISPIVNDNGIVCYSKSMEKILLDPDREQLCIDVINKLYKDDNNILIFVEYREYADKIYNKLKDIYREDFIEMEVLKGGVNAKTIEQCKKSRIVISTFSYGRRGISYDHLNALVMITPRKSQFKQIIGRILRYSGDEKKPRYVVDIVDKATIVRSQIYERLKVYQSRLYNISSKSIKKNEIF